MSLDIIFDVCETKTFYENEEYMNNDDCDEIAFNERCQMRTIDSVKNDYELLDALSLIAFYDDKEVENCQYTVFYQEDLEKLTSKNISEDGREVIAKVLREVDFDHETVTVYPWW
ncbi:hypothetical protein [Acetobacterium wieringae]|jgi:hypothetical protein|uniref:hypothetical protein n=1 Tax=Acetobacterium wieringae TaxID=52694 RepID=UPI000E867BE9|nr:hypothetical protein [Acetobacterium wieringae]MEA4806228.1 hypothetical protein [Acetobacterium wieringae]HAZ05584.1 hypothetical protein [Acetobacterium sp.]